MQVLIQHVRGDKYGAAFTDIESFGILFGIFADDGTLLEHRAAVDDRALDVAVLADVDVGQDDGILYGAVRVHVTA